MRYLVAFIILHAGVCLSAQVIDIDDSITRAVIVGISNYQDPAIPDLRFADRDAEAFSEYLQSAAGGVLSKENIKVLTNNKATNAQFTAALTWLMEESQEDDLAIIYFAGHGDVEVKMRSQPGFLLTWDTPGQSYMAGAFPLYYLQEVVTTLSVEIKARVLVISDACHAGNLAGGNIGGAGLTSLNLAKQFGNEVKIMSCQANELSMEGEQWGGGRGVFSYYLVEGLYGLADANNDQQVSLFEMSRYLEDKVSTAVAPHSQIPMTVGNRTEVLSTVVPDLLAKRKLQSAAGNPSDGNQAVASRSPKPGEEQYLAFEQTLSDRRFFEPPGANADELFQKMMADPAMSSKHKAMRRDFAAALQDEAQQALNALLECDPAEVNNYFYNPEKYAEYPKYLQRSIELLDKGHVSMKSLKAKQLFFEAFNLSRVAGSKSTDQLEHDSLNYLAKQQLFEAIALQPDAAYLYNALGFLHYMADPPYTDSLLIYCQKAIEISPTWLMPYLHIAGEYHWVGDIEKEAEWMGKAVSTTSDSVIVMERLCWLRMYQNQLDEALRLADRLIMAKPNLFNGYANKGGVNFLLKNYPEAEKWMLKSQEFYKSPYQFSNDYLGYLYLATRRKEKGTQHYEQLIADDRSAVYLKARFYNWLGDGLINFTTDWTKAEKCYRESEALETNIAKTCRNTIRIGKIRVMQGKWREANATIRKVLNYDPKPNPALILAYALLGDIEANAGNLQAAEDFYKQALAYSTGDYPFDLAFKEEAMYRYGVFLLHQNRLDEAESQFRTCMDYSHGGGYFGYYGMALCMAKQLQNDAALDFLEKALEHYYPISKPILEEPLFNHISASPRFSEMMKRNFPLAPLGNQIKD